MTKNIQYGCGLDAPETWLNFDASINLLFQKLPLGRNIARRANQPIFPSIVRYGNILSGLPVAALGADCIYCSHVVEHFSLIDLRRALNNTLKIMKPGGVFRLVTPDLEFLAKKYISSKDINACSEFIKDTGLGKESSAYTIRSTIKNMTGTFGHLWLWDFKGLSSELQKQGFINIRRAYFNDSEFTAFHAVENPGRWTDALGIECFRPQ